MAREPSVRQLARTLNGSAPNYQQTGINSSLEETLDQDNAGSAGTEPLPKASKSTTKRKTPAKKTPTSKPRQRSKRTTAAVPVAPSEQDEASLESRKRKASDADLEEPASKKLSAQDVGREPVSSELSVLGSTPEHPGVLGNESLEEQHVVESEDVRVDAISAVETTLDTSNLLVESAVAASSSPHAATPEQPEFLAEGSLDKQPPFPSRNLGVTAVATIESAPAAPSSLVESAIDSPILPLVTDPLIVPVEEDAENQTPSDSVAESAGPVSPTSVTPAGPRQIIRLKHSPPRPSADSQNAPSPDQCLDSQAVSDPAASLPTPTSGHQRRTVKPPVRFREPTDVSADSIEEERVVDDGDDDESAGESPAVSKAARKTKTTIKSRTKAPVSAEKVTVDDLADDVPAPATTKAPRKRKAEGAQSTPRKKVATPRAKAQVTKAPKAPKVPKTPKARKAPASKPSAALPSPASSPSDQEVDFPVDADLLKLSRSMTRREPLASKPNPMGKPEVWAPGRQELCETLPYFKSAHSGCYANDGTVYGFMFDSTGVGREYMDSDVVIARMGGNMKVDEKTKVMYQTQDHLMRDKQPQSLLNNIAHKNPLPIICGDKNEGAITKMPHRYCVLDWFKPTHVWGEKTMDRKTPRTTIRYRFERLDRSKKPWYMPAAGSGAQSITQPESLTELVSAESGSPTEAGSSAELDSPPKPPASTNLSLTIQTCTACSKSCPQVYLINWLCTNPDCTAFWKLPNGQDAPYGHLDYHPAFLQHRTAREREDPPFSVNPGVPNVDQHFGASLAYVSTRGVVCPDCCRCNIRYKFTHWRCDMVGCKWKLVPRVQVVMPSNLGHTPWDMSSDGPGMIKAVIKPAVRTQVKYLSNYKVIRYTIDGVVGSVTVAKANQHIVSEPGGANDMFRELQTTKNVGLERRIMRKTADTEQPQSRQQTTAEPEVTPDLAANEDEDVDNDQPGEAGARMTAFGMNFGMPYKFIATGDTQSFEAAPAAVRAVRSRLNWAQRVFVNDESGYQDFNELLIFAYLEGQKIKYHDDGEEGLGPRIATLSLGAPATMSLRVKAKYFSQVSKTGVFTDEPPLPLPLLESCGYASGYTTRAKDSEKQASKTVSKDTYAARLAARDELQDLRAKGEMATFRSRSKELSKEIQLKRKDADALLSFRLTHGDIVIMEGEEIQKFMEHMVEPDGHLRFAMTTRTILPAHLSPDQIPPYEVLPDSEGYDGAAIREERDEGREAIVWE
jgi:hypothetical protein